MPKIFEDYANEPEALVADEIGGGETLITEARVLKSPEFAELVRKLEKLSEEVGSERHNTASGQYYDKAVQKRREVQDAVIAAYHDVLVALAGTK